jgi:ABC-type multidrug transport system fused ATPase/permease subunit
MNPLNLWGHNRVRVIGFSNQVRQVMSFLDVKTKLLLATLGLLQVIFSLLDLIAIFLVGLITIVLINSSNEQQSSELSKFVLEVLIPSNADTSETVIRLATIIVVLLVVKTALSILLTKKSFSLLSLKAVELSTDTLRKILDLPNSKFKRLDKQSIIFSITEGSRSVFIEIIGSGLVLFSDLLLLIMLFLALAYVDLALSLTSVVFFMIVGTYLFATLHRKARVYGELNSQLSLASRKSLIQIFEGQKHIYVSGRTDLYIKDFNGIRSKYAKVDSVRSFIPYIGKYVIETAIILAGILMGGLQFFLNEADVAMTNLAIFFAATTRIAPAVLRVQQSLIQISGGFGVSATLMHLLHEIRLTKSRGSVISSLQPVAEFNASISMKDVSFIYPDTNIESLSEISTEIKAGEFVLVVGNSGSGKTTFVDLMLGLLVPTAGDVLISGLKPIEAIQKWPKRISYLDQEHFLPDGTIYSNIVPLDAKNSKIDITELLKSVSLFDLIESLPEGVNQPIGDGGKLFSGGQRQRICLARALFDRPDILVLDEGTSALDWNTEKEIIDAINLLHGKVTVVMISHKATSSFLADKVVYLEKGRIMYQGEFGEFQHKFPGVVTEGKTNE